MENKKIAMKVSITTIIANTLLSIIKFIAGILAHSGAMISDAIHTISDVISTIVAMIGVAISNKKEDKEHQYGHEKFECIASILLAVLLFITALEIGIEGITKIIDGSYVDLEAPGLLAIVAAVISIITKEWMYQYTIRNARKIKSSALEADAWHHRSDMVSSLGALIGIGLSILFNPAFDIVAAVVIAIFIAKVAIKIFKDATDKIVDKSCDQEMIKEIKRITLEQEGVLRIDDIKTRQFGMKAYVDIEISADGNKTLNETHDIAEKVHNEIEKEFPIVKHCMVHVNPYEEKRKK